MEKWYVKYFLKDEYYTDCVFADNSNDAISKYKRLNQKFSDVSAQFDEIRISSSFHETDEMNIVSYVIQGRRYTEAWYLSKETIESFIETMYPNAVNISFTDKKEPYYHINHMYKGNNTSKSSGEPSSQAILFAILVFIACILLPLIITILNYFPLRITKKQKEKPVPSGYKFKKIRLIFTIAAIIHYALAILFIVLYKTVKEAFLNAAIQYLLWGGIAYGIIYYIIYRKFKDDFFPETSNDDLIDNKENNEETKDNQSNNDHTSLEVKDSSNSNIDNNSQNEIDYDKQFEIIVLLKKYKDLLDSGIITEEDFIEKKKELLDL